MNFGHSPVTATNIPNSNSVNVALSIHATNFINASPLNTHYHDLGNNSHATISRKRRRLFLFSMKNSRNVAHKENITMAQQDVLNTSQTPISGMGKPLPTNFSIILNTAPSHSQLKQQQTHKRSILLPSSGYNLLKSFNATLEPVSTTINGANSTSASNCENETPNIT